MLAADYYHLVTRFIRSDGTLPEVFYACQDDYKGRDPIRRCNGCELQRGSIDERAAGGVGELARTWLWDRACPLVVHR